MDKADFLRRTPLFSSCDDKEIASILATAKERSFDEGDAIIREGREGGRAFFLLLSGSAEVYKGSTLLATYEPGDYFGEMALLLEDQPRTASVVATSAASALAITAWDLKALLTQHPEIGVKMMGELARRLADTDAKLG